MKANEDNSSEGQAQHNICYEREDYDGGETGGLEGSEGDNKKVENDDIKSETVTEDSDRRLKWYKRISGFGLMLAAIRVALLTGAELTVQKMNRVNPVVLLFYRSCTIMSLALPLSIISNNPPFPADRPLRHRALIVLRGFISCVGSMASFYSLQHMPLGDYKMMYSCRPVLTLLSARIFLKEPVGWVEALATVLMLSGVVMTIKPAFIFGSDLIETVDDEYYLGALVFMGSIVLTANTQVILRFLRKENFLSLIFAREIQFTVLIFVVINIAEMVMVSLTVWEKLQVLGIASLNILTSSLNIFALKLEDANKIALLDRSWALLLAFIVQIAFGEYPDIYTIVGICCVLTGIIAIGVKKIVNKSNKNVK